MKLSDEATYEQQIMDLRTALRKTQLAADKRQTILDRLGITNDELLAILS